MSEEKRTLGAARPAKAALAGTKPWMDDAPATAADFPPFDPKDGISLDMWRYFRVRAGIVGYDAKAEFAKALAAVRETGTWTAPDGSVAFGGDKAPATP